MQEAPKERTVTKVTPSTLKGEPTLEKDILPLLFSQITAEWQEPKSIKNCCAEEDRWSSFLSDQTLFSFWSREL